MKKVNVRFTVTTNCNIYFATSQKAMVSFCKKYDFCIDRDWGIDAVSITQQNQAEKCGRGIYCIPE